MKKRALSLLMAFVMVIGLLPATVRAADSTLKGDISVGTAEGLQALGGREIEGNITLTGNIDMTGVDMEPIKSLTGCFNGDGYTISNLSLTGGNYANTGLIRQLDGSIINLIVDNASITSIGKGNNAGILVGVIPQGSTSKIDNCYVNGSITSTESNIAYIGGLIGKLGQSSASTLVINNSVSNVNLNCRAINYVGGLVGVTQWNCDVTVQDCSVLGDVTADGSNGCAGGLFGSSYGGTLSIENTIVAGKIIGTKKGVIAYATGSPTTTANNFYYDSTLNPDKSYEQFPVFPKGNSSVTITGEVTKKTTVELKNLELKGFEVRKDQSGNDQFGGYPVPVWTPAAAPDPVTPEPSFSCTLTFTGTENGTVTVKGPSGEPVAPKEDKTYTLTETGKYTYTVTGMEQYKDVNGSFEIGKGDNEQTKTISVPHEYKEVELKGTGTQNDPIQISTALELRTFASKVNDGELFDAYVELKNDITVSGSWTPLGKNTDSPFSGHFDGKGKSVTITVDNPGPSYFGFFGCLDSKIDRDSTTSIDDQPTVVVENLTVDGTVYTLRYKDGLYIGRGSRDISFASADPEHPAKFYLNSCPAHKEYPTVYIRPEDCVRVELGSLEQSNHRTICKYILPGQVESCQLVMGMTQLQPGSVWNTMPCHTHDRRMEVYLYFDMPKDAFVMHYMGEPQETRHIVMRNEQAVISPSWSIHAGSGSQAYTFIWGMCGENQDFDDMDGVATTDIL